MPCCGLSLRSTHSHEDARRHIFPVHVMAAVWASVDVCRSSSGEPSLHRDQLLHLMLLLHLRALDWHKVTAGTRRAC